MTTIKDNVRQTSLFTMSGLSDPRLFGEKKATVEHDTFADFILSIKKVLLNRKTTIG